MIEMNSPSYDGQSFLFIVINSHYNIVFHVDFPRESCPNRLHAWTNRLQAWTDRLQTWTRVGSMQLSAEPSWAPVNTHAVSFIIMC